MFGTSIKHRLLGLSAVLLLSAAPASSWATCTTTYVYNNGSAWTSTSTSPGTTSTVLAVAANFTTKLTTWLETYFAPNYSTSNVYQLCSDSTGNIEAAMNSATLKPSVVFAADYSASNTDYTDSGTYYLYAKGYPILLGYNGGVNGSGSAVTKSISSLGDLISSLSGSTNSSYEIDLTTLSSYTLSTTITANSSYTYTSLIADPNLAPYGATAANILNSFSNGLAIQYYGGDVDSSAPGWLEPLDSTSYSSITKAFNKIGIDTPTGFAAYAQICGTTVPSNAIYVKFSGDTTNVQNHFMTHQWLGYVHANDSNSIGSEILSLVKTEIANGVWNSFITTNGCYAAVPTSQSGANTDDNFYY